MAPTDNLARFLDAQTNTYEAALKEIKSGRKTSHWMWFIFPQIAGLGLSETARFYAIRNAKEAAEYLAHPVLGTRLIEISTALAGLSTNNAIEVFGSIDSMKLKSSMTLFSLLENAHPVFQKVLDKFFDGKKDEKTVALLNTTG